MCANKKKGGVAFDQLNNESDNQYGARLDQEHADYVCSYHNGEKDATFDAERSTDPRLERIARRRKELKKSFYPQCSAQKSREHTIACVKLYVNCVCTTTDNTSTSTGAPTTNCPFFPLVNGIFLYQKTTKTIGDPRFGRLFTKLISALSKFEEQHPYEIEIEQSATRDFYCPAIASALSKIYTNTDITTIGSRPYVVTIRTDPRITALVEKMTHGHILPLIALVDGGYNEFIRWVNYVVNDMHSANVAIVGLDKIINDIGVNPAHVEASASEENVDMTVPLRELRHNLAAFVNFLTIVLELSKIVMRSNGTFKQIELGNPFHDKFVCRMLETILDDKKKIREDCSREDRLGVGVDAHQTAVCEMEAMIAFYVRARTTYNDDCEKYAAATSGSDLEKHTQLLPLS